MPKIKHDKVYDFEDALYNSKCYKCNEELYWEADFDADGTSYSTSCCMLLFTMFPHTVLVNVEVQENDDA